MNTPWMSVDQLAVYLGVSKETVYRLLERNKLPAHRIGKLWKFNAVEIDRAVKKGRLRTVKKGRLRN